MEVQHRLSEWAVEKPLFPKHMRFILGPRQAGKTTLALNTLKDLNLPKERYYFNWDRDDVRRRFRENIDWLSALGVPKGVRVPVLVFDEIHKVRNWKRLLKGIHDQYRDDFRFIVTGSGRLDHYQRGGDSLAGRYDPYLLFPFTPGEIEGGGGNDLDLKSLLEAEPCREETVDLWERLGGFPEPFLSGKEAAAKAWWKQYQIRVTEEDLRDLTKLESVDLMREILRLLPGKVASPLSLQSIREDVETSFATVKRYVSTLSQLFLTFEVEPYSKKIHRAVKKEKKLYFYHHPAVVDEGARFENMVALILKRWASERTERGLGTCEIFYLRDQDRREVDFLVSVDRRPTFLVEAKRSDTAVAPSLRYYSEKLGIPGVQVARAPGIRLKKEKDLAVVSVHSLAARLG